MRTARKGAGRGEAQAPYQDVLAGRSNKLRCHPLANRSAIHLCSCAISKELASRRYRIWTPHARAPAAARGGTIVSSARPLRLHLWLAVDMPKPLPGCSAALISKHV
jgi:hypothetical protein